MASTELSCEVRRRRSPYSPVEADETKEQPGDSAVTEAVALGGLGTFGQLKIHYSKIARQFIPPPHMGLMPPKECSLLFLDDLERTYESLGGFRLWLVGHSYGALLATIAAIKRPHLVRGVTTMGGVHLGIKEHTRSGTIIKAGARLAHTGLENMLDHDDEFILEHEARMTEDWPPDTPLHVIGTVMDELAPPPNGFNVKLPNGQQPIERLICLGNPIVEAGFRRFHGIKSFDVSDNVEIWSGDWVSHLGLPRYDRAIEDIGRQMAMADGFSLELSPEPALAAA